MLYWLVMQPHPIADASTDFVFQLLSPLLQTGQIKFSLVTLFDGGLDGEGTHL